MSETAGEGEVYCVECGNVISERAEICPDCGVRQPVGGGSGQQAATGPTTATRQATNGRSGPDNTATVGGQQRSGQRGRQDVGIVYAHVDAQQRKRLLRNLFDLALALSSVGFYLGLIVVEGIRHYYKLKRGQREPFDPERHERTWFV